MGKVMRVIRRAVNIVIGLQIRAVKWRIRLTKDDSASRSQSLNHNGIRIRDSLVGTFGVSDEAMLDVVFGQHNPVGKLPFELPSSMAEVEAQLEDVPDDTANPLFPYGWGLSY